MKLVLNRIKAQKLYWAKLTQPIHLYFCVPEDCMLLEGGVLYGFTGVILGMLYWKGFMNLRGEKVRGDMRHVKKYHLLLYIAVML